VRKIKKAETLRKKDQGLLPTIGDKKDPLGKSAEQFKKNIKP